MSLFVYKIVCCDRSNGQTVWDHCIPDKSDALDWAEKWSSTANDQVLVYECQPSISMNLIARFDPDIDTDDPDD